MSIKVILSAGITFLLLPIVKALGYLKALQPGSTVLNMCWRKQETTYTDASSCCHYKQQRCINPHAIASCHFLRNSICVPARPRRNRKTLFHFLSPACFTSALCCYLQASTYIPAQCDTSRVPPRPPPADSPPCLFLIWLLSKGIGWGQDYIESC